LTAAGSRDRRGHPGSLVSRLKIGGAQAREYVVRLNAHGQGHRPNRAVADPIVMQRENAFLTGMEFRSAVPTHVGAAWETNEGLALGDRALVDTPNLDNRVAPKGIMFADPDRHSGSRSRGGGSGNRSPGKSDRGDFAAHHRCSGVYALADSVLRGGAYGVPSDSTAGHRSSWSRWFMSERPQRNILSEHPAVCIEDCMFPARHAFGLFESLTGNRRGFRAKRRALARGLAIRALERHLR
jgi:hypothetical protein